MGDPIKGWFWPERARTAHYFDLMSPYSACRYYAVDDRGTLCHIAYPECKTCRRVMGNSVPLTTGARCLT